MQDIQAIHSADERHLTDYLRMIRRRWISSVVVFSLIMAVVSAYNYWVKPIYEASGTLQVLDSKSAMQVPWETKSPLETEIEIIRSRTVAEQVVQRLHLNWQISERSKGLGFKLLEVNLVPPLKSVKVVVTGKNSYTVKTLAGKDLASGISGTQLDNPAFSILLTDLKGKPEDSFILRMVPVSSVAMSVRKTLVAGKVVGATSQSNVMLLSYQDTDPIRARDILNNIIQSYQEKTTAYKTEEATRTIEFLEGQLKSIDKELDIAEKKVEEYKKSAGIYTLDGEAGLIFGRLTAIDLAQLEQGQQRKLLELAMNSVRNARSKGTSYFPSDPIGMTIMTKMEELDSQKKALLGEYTPEHPQVKAVQAQISEQLRQLLMIYQSAVAGVDEKTAFLQKKLAVEEKDLAALPQEERELIKRMRVSKVNADTYSLLMQKYQEARIAKASSTGNANIIDPAIVPDSPVSPQKRKNLLLGLVIGLFLGIGYAFFLEYLDDTIKDSDAALREMGAPVLAVIPHISRKIENGHSAGTLVAYQQPQSPSAEAFRGLRTSIHFSAVNRRKQLLLITSCFPGEGKSTIIANLAAIYEQTGAKVLLMDCDLRRPSLHNLFQVDKFPGLTDVLAGDIPWAEALRTVADKKLNYLTAGTTPPNPAEVLGSESMKSLIDELRELYDYIFIDAPPVLAVTDAPVLTSLADIVLPVIETARVPAKAARRMGDILENAKAPVVGLVVNDKSGQSARYGYYGYYGYSYYGEDKSQMKPLVWWRRLFGRKQRHKNTGNRDGA
jgi:tyrosine-protein kinase Etk/Wzc